MDISSIEKDNFNYDKNTTLIVMAKEGNKEAMKRKTIAILFGGKSSEYEVSLQSAAAIIKNFPQEKYDLYLIGITIAFSLVLLRNSDLLWRILKIVIISYLLDAKRL